MKRSLQVHMLSPLGAVVRVRRARQRRVGCRDRRAPREAGTQRVRGAHLHGARETELLYSTSSVHTIEPTYEYITRTYVYEYYHMCISEYSILEKRLLIDCRCYHIIRAPEIEFADVTMIILRTTLNRVSDVTIF